MLNLPLPLAATEFWMTTWLTPIWLVGMGVGAGLIAFAAVLGVLWLLSRIAPLEQFRRSGWPAHGAAFAISIVLGGLLAWWARSFFPVEPTENSTSEWALIATALWILSALVSWALIFCPNRRLFGEARSLFFEGIGAFLLLSLIVISITGVMCSAIVNQPIETLASLQELFSTGQRSQTVTVAGIDLSNENSPLEKVDINYDSPRLVEVEIKSDRNILMADAANPGSFAMKPVRVEANTPLSWRRQGVIPPPLPVLEGAGLYIQNYEIDPATVTITWRTLPPVPQVITIIFAAITVVCFGLFYIVVEGISPRASAIALASAKSEVSQPLFFVLMIMGLCSIGLFVCMPFNTFGEDIKLLKDCGITVILVLSMIQGIWSASSSVSEEIEGRTALTVLSKPVSRTEFIIGKMVGVFYILLLMFVILGACLLLAVAYKPLYDAREASQETPMWQICHMEVMSTLPGLAMALVQAGALSAFSVAIATRVPQLANFAICFAIYLIGHLTESIVASSESGFAIIQFVGQLIAVIVPNLEHFSMQAAIDSGNPIPISYLSGTLIYGVLYSVIFILLGLLLFEDRDLA